MFESTYAADEISFRQALMRVNMGLNTDKDRLLAPGINFKKQYYQRHPNKRHYTSNHKRTSVLGSDRTENITE